MRLLSSSPFKLSPPPGDAPRAAGLHVSEIILDLGVREGILPKSWGGKKADDSPHDYWETGFAWEQAIEREHKARVLAARRAGIQVGRVIRQRPVVLEGIHMTPDGLWLPAGAGFRTLEEYKLTWAERTKEATRLLVDKWSWKVQTMAYCHALKVRRVRFLVCWARFRPGPMEYVFKYGKIELQRNFDMLLRHAAVMRRAA